MQKAGLLASIRGKNIAVLGDLILDQYTFGEIQRISPEAPVPVVELKRTEYRPGGAGNVIANLRSLGMRCLAFGRVGVDEASARLKALFGTEDLSGMVVSKKVPTTLKNRVIAQHQQIIRLDQETILELDPAEEDRVLKALERSLPSLDAVVLSDYGKGFLTSRVLSGAISAARRRGVPVVVDPKGADFRKYLGATVITPNRKEAFAASPLSASLDSAAEDIMSQAGLDFLMVTLSEDGIAMYEKTGKGISSRRFPVRVQEVMDVTGAGDTVVAVTAMCLANGLPRDFLCRLSNTAAGYVVGHFGAVSVDFGTLRKLALGSKDKD